MITIIEIEKLDNGNEVVHGRNDHGEFKIEKINSYKLGFGYGTDSIEKLDICAAIDSYKPEAVKIDKPVDPFRDELIKTLSVELFRDAPTHFDAENVITIVDSIMEARG